MANVKFRLRSQDKKQDKTNEPETPRKIYLAYVFTVKNGDSTKQDKLLYPTPFKVMPDYWNAKNQRVSSSKVIEKDKINNYLNELSTKTDIFITDQKAQRRQITKDSLKKFLDEYHNPTETNDNSFFGFIEKFIKQSETRINPETGQKIRETTIQKYNVTLRILKEFAGKNKRVIDFDTIDMDFYNDFNKFMQNFEIIRKKKVNGKVVEFKSVGFATNTIGKYMTTIKTFLNEATNRGLTKNRFHQNRAFKVVREESESVYLNETELTQMYNTDLTKDERLERIRDLFIVGAWTGLRFSDLTQITADKIKDGFIYIKQEKTGGKVVIPLHWTVKKILEKYNNELPRKISNQKMNEYIKEVCQKVEIKEDVHKAITKGGVRVSKQYSKWELVSSHTARRSFATNLYKQGFPSISIMQITGHKTEKAFMKYIKVTPDEHAKLLQMHWQNMNKLRVV
jgi:integrase